MVDQLILAKKICYVKWLCNIFTVLNLERGYICNLNFSGPFSLVSGYLDLGTRYQLVILFLRAWHVVNEVCAVFILGIESCLIFPPGLLSLYIGFDHNLVIYCCSKVLIMSHNALGLHISFLGSISLIRSSLCGLFSGILLCHNSSRKCKSKGERHQ